MITSFTNYYFWHFIGLLFHLQRLLEEIDLGSGTEQAINALHAKFHFCKHQPSKLHSVLTRHDVIMRKRYPVMLPGIAPRTGSPRPRHIKMQRTAESAT